MYIAYGEWLEVRVERLVVRVEGLEIRDLRDEKKFVPGFRSLQGV